MTVRFWHAFHGSDKLVSAFFFFFWHDNILSFCLLWDNTAYSDLAAFSLKINILSSTARIKLDSYLKACALVHPAAQLHLRVSHKAVPCLLHPAQSSAPPWGRPHSHSLPEVLPGRLCAFWFQCDASARCRREIHSRLPNTSWICCTYVWTHNIQPGLGHVLWYSIWQAK